MDVEITRVGDELRIRPVRNRKLTDLHRTFSAFSDDFMQSGREDQEQEDRETL